METTMTYLGTHYPIAGAPHGEFRVRPAGIFGRIWKWIRRPALIKAQQRQLYQLSDRMLKDIGLSRCDIDSLAASLVDGQSDRTRSTRGR
jgi:uncharacterized protein YjiS (DUF1127 family)